MIDNKFERVAEDSPDRCHAIITGPNAGQCPYKKTPGLDFCPMHMGNGAFHLEKKKIRNFRLGQYQARVEEFADSGEVKSLREEVGITRMLLEETVVKCQTSTDLIMFSQKISDLVMKIDKLVNSCHKLEQSTGMLLDKNTLTQLADVIVKIIGDNIEDEVVLGKIANQIITAILTMQGIKPE